MLHVDDQPFLLVSKGNWAWSDGPRQEQAIVEALRGSTGMSVNRANRPDSGSLTLTRSTGQRRPSTLPPQPALAKTSYDN